MSLIDALVKAGGKQAVSKVASNFNLQDVQAAKAIDMIMPALTDAMKKNAEADGGAGLAKAIETGDHGRVLDEPDVLTDEETTKDGKGILGHVLGSKDASRAIAARVADAVGIDNATVEKMMPTVASMAMGALSKGSKEAEQSEGGLADTLGGLLKSQDAGKLLGSILG